MKLGGKAEQLLKHSRVIAFACLLAYGAYGYIPIAVEYSRYWFVSYRLNPMDDRLTQPLLLFSVEREGDLLAVKIFRTYAMPLAKDLALKVELCSAAGACTLIFFRQEVATGCMYTFTVYLSSIEVRVEEVAEVRVIAELNGKPVLNEVAYLSGEKE